MSFRTDDTDCVAPALYFSAGSVTFHVVLAGLSTVEVDQLEDSFTYHEREFLAYAQRDHPPFIVRRLALSEHLRNVRCSIP